MQAIVVQAITTSVYKERAKGMNGLGNKQDTVRCAAGTGKDVRLSRSVVLFRLIDLRVSARQSAAR